MSAPEGGCAAEESYKGQDRDGDCEADDGAHDGHGVGTSGCAGIAGHSHSKRGTVCCSRWVSRRDSACQLFMALLVA
jgi:hypothetical protein